MKKIQVKNHLLQLVTIVIVLIMCINSNSLPIQALTFNGSASSGGSAGSMATGNAGYAVPSGFTTGNKTIGYRFTIVNSSGAVYGNSFDLFRSTAGTYASSSYYKFDIKYPKTLLKSLYSSGSFSTSSTTSRCAYDTDYGLSLPEDTTGIQSWCETTSYVSTLLDRIWGCSINSLESNNLAILVEPIYPVKLEGQYHSLTVTEIAVYGASKFGADSVPVANTNSGSWNFISNYTNRYFPNSLRLASEYFGIPAASELSSRTSFYNIITGGYGAAVLFGEYTQKITYSVTFAGNGATSGSMESQSMNFGESSKLLKNKFKREFNVQFDGNGGEPSVKNVTVPSTFKGWIDQNPIKFEDLTYQWWTFDAPYYANLYPDLLNYFGYDKYHLIEHWVGTTLFGSESRTSSELFNVAWYLNTYSALGTDKSYGATHWNNHGYSEGRHGQQNPDYTTSNTYPDEASVKNLTNINNATLTLKAKWEDGSIELGSATREGHTLIGWNTNADGSGTSYNIGDTFTPSEDTTLYAQWNSPPYFTDSDGNYAKEDEITLIVGNAFNPMEYVNANDAEDGNLTSNVIVTSNNVPVDENGNTTTIGKYTVNYSVTDSSGDTGAYVLTVNVVPSKNKFIAGYIRFIKLDFIDTLIENSKWRTASLNSYLKSILSRNLNDVSSCEQVWKFSSDDYKQVRKWCLEHKKGSQTNKDFLDKFKNNRINLKS